MSEGEFAYVPGGVTAPRGFRAAGVHAGLKKKAGEKDLAVLAADTRAAAAGVFTTNRIKAAPLQLTMARTAQGYARAVVVNSGNANACTGEQGRRDARETARRAAELLAIPETEVLVASTGVIGLSMPMDKIRSGLPAAAAALRPEGGGDAARAIMTTDTIPKEVAVSFTIGGRKITIGGMAKGSGMIHPNMATMLAFITTDIVIPPPHLQGALRHACAHSFNLVSVDGDTSTNDMCLALANGMAANPPVQPGTAEFNLFREALKAVCIKLAKAIARDGEGATRLLEVRVRNAPTADDARRAARAVSASSLVKTAIFGRDANWGRIICAVGYSGAEFNPDAFDVYLGDLAVARGGQALDFDEERAAAILGGDAVVVTVDLHSGAASAVAWGCDLSYDYVRINADYRT